MLLHGHKKLKITHTPTHTHTHTHTRVTALFSERSALRLITLTIDRVLFEVRGESEETVELLAHNAT